MHMTLNIKLEEDIDLFTKVLNAAAAVLEDEGTFLITPSDGVTLRNMDKSRFAMVDLKIKPSFFKGSFNCDKDYIITIQMQDLKKILQRARKDDTLTLELNEKNDTLNFLFEGSVKKKFVLPLQAGEETSLPDLSSLQHSAEAKLKGGALTEFIKDAAIIGGHHPAVKITAETGKLKFSSAHDKKEVSIEITTSKEGELQSDALEIEADGICESLYSVDTFKNLILVDQAFTSVSLAFKSDHPLKLVYNHNDELILGYLLAPMQPDVGTEEEEDESDEALSDEEDWDEEDEEFEDWDDDDE